MAVIRDEWVLSQIELWPYFVEIKGSLAALIPKG
jgi:hypothetical protein